MQQVNIREARAQLSRLIGKVQAGEEIIIARRNIPVAKLAPLDAVKPDRRLGGLKGMVIEMSEDFDEPLPGFEARDESLS